MTVHDSSCMRQFDKFLTNFPVKNREKPASIWNTWKKCLARGFYFVFSLPLAVKKRIIRHFCEINEVKLWQSSVWINTPLFEMLICWYQAEIIIGQNPTYLWPLSQSESWISSFHMKISFHSHANELIWIWKVNTRTRFEKEAKGSSEMACSLHFISNPWNFHTLPLKTVLVVALNNLIAFKFSQYCDTSKPLQIEKKNIWEALKGACSSFSVWSWASSSFSWMTSAFYFLFN